MAIIKTAILQTHVYTEKSRNITQAAELLATPGTSGNRSGSPARNVLLSLRE